MRVLWLTCANINVSTRLLATPVSAMRVMSTMSITQECVTMWMSVRSHPALTFATTRGGPTTVAVPRATWQRIRATYAEQTPVSLVSCPGKLRTILIGL